MHGPASPGSCKGLFGADKWLVASHCGCMTSQHVDIPTVNARVINNNNNNNNRRLSQACPLFLCLHLLSTDPGEQPRTGAAQRRKQRRLRSWWRHEQQSIAATLATSLNHSSRGHRKARAGEEESELKCTAKFRTSPPPQPVLFSLYDEEPGGWRPASLAEPPGPQERVPQRTVEPMLETFVPVPSLDVPVLQMVDQPVNILQILEFALPEQVVYVPKISLDSAPQRTLLPEPHPCPLLRFTWLGGFDWCQTPSSGATARPGASRPWYRAASVPAHRQSGGVPWSRLSQQLRTVQTVQFWGVRGELQRQVPAVPRRL